MKILFFSWRDINHPWAGGSEVNTQEIAKRWVSQGHQVGILCSHYPKRRASSDRDRIDGIEIYRVGGRFSIYLLAPIYYLLNLRNKYDIIIDVENGIPFFTPLFCLKPKCCLVHHIHRAVFFVEMKFPFNVLGFLLETKLMPLVYRWTPFVTVSHNTEDEVHSLGIKNTLDIIYNGVDHSLYKAGKDKYKNPTIIYLGRLRRYKRIDILFNILERIVKKNPNIKLIIAGDGEDRKRLVVLSKRKGLNGHIEMMGFVNQDKKIELLQKSWLFISPSSMEGWGVSVIEANACGTPALAFKVPGLSESIIDGYSGFLADNQQEMETKIEDLLSNTQLRNRMAENALKRAAEFDWRKSADKFMFLLRGLVKS